MTGFLGDGWLWPFAVAAICSIAVASAGALLTDIGPWYKSLKKPSWQPPDWLFGPAWTTIFTFIALSATVAWQFAPDTNARWWVVGLFAVNAVLNAAWSLLFFHWRKPPWALAEVAFLWLSIVVLIVVLAGWSGTASLLLVPYLLWVSFASFLNLTIVRLNWPS